MKKVPVFTTINGMRTFVGQADVEKKPDGSFAIDFTIDISKVLGKNWTKSLGPFSIGH